MNCWKEINISRQYGTKRLYFISTVTMLFAFIFLYLLANYLFSPESMDSHYLLFFIISLWFMYPIHKMIHFIPLFNLYSKVKITFILKYYLFPVIQIQIVEPIAKWIYIVTLITPFFVINSILVTACYFFNPYSHFIIFLLAFHIGICVSDFISLKNVLSAPNRAYIEENDDGFEILIMNSKEIM